MAALASWLDARRASAARWLVRIEDADTERCLPGMGEEILRQLAACGLLPDEPPRLADAAHRALPAALDQLVAAALAYPCGCSRKDIERGARAQGIVHARHGERVYPAPAAMACAASRRGPGASPASKPPGIGAHWKDRRLGARQQDVAREVGDFVLKRADGPWAYQLAVVVDDAEQGVTDVVRGEDLADNTARQILLQRALGLPTPSYLHTPLVLGADGDKLSKQNGAQRSLDTGGGAGRPERRGAGAGSDRRGTPHRRRSARLWVPQWRDSTIAPW